MIKVTAYTARKSVATLLREFADANGVTYEARNLPELGGVLGYFVNDRRVTRDEIMEIMDTGRVHLPLT